jgi:flagellin
MTTEAIGGTTSVLLANFYNINQYQLNQSMVNISSGKRFQTPADNAVDYFHAAKMRSNVSGLQQSNRDIAGAVATLDVAKAVGTSVYNDLSHLNDLVNTYYDDGTTDDQKTAITADFNSTKSRIENTINDSSYNNRKLVAATGDTPLTQVILDPSNVADTYQATYDAGDVADASGLTLGVTDKATEQAAVETEFDKASSYLAKTTVYSDSLKAYYDMNGQTEATYEKNAEDTENIDGGAASMELVKQQLCQQMTVSMMAQANMNRSSVLTLIGAGK